MKETLKRKIYVNEFMAQIKKYENNEEKFRQYTEWAYNTGDIAEALNLLTIDEVWGIKSNADEAAEQHIKNMEYLREHPELLELLEDKSA